MQCFDAFEDAAMGSVQKSAPSSSSSVNIVALSSVLSALGGALVASVVAFVLMRQQRNYFMGKMSESSVMLLQDNKADASTHI
jgi:hypothetical protein